MVEFDFKAEGQSLATERETDLLAESAAALRWDYFQLPVRLVVGDTVVLDWEQVAVLYLATLSLETVSDLPRVGRTDTMIPEKEGLFLRMDGNDVLVSYAGTGRYGRAPYSELLDAWQSFARKVRAFLLAEFSQLRDHPEMGEWFRAED